MVTDFGPKYAVFRDIQYIRFTSLFFSLTSQDPGEAVGTVGAVGAVGCGGGTSPSHDEVRSA